MCTLHPLEDSACQFGVSQRIVLENIVKEMYHFPWNNGHISCIYRTDWANVWLLIFRSLTSKLHSFQEVVRVGGLAGLQHPLIRPCTCHTYIPRFPTVSFVPFSSLWLWLVPVSCYRELLPDQHRTADLDFSQRVVQFWASPAALTGHGGRKKMGFFCHVRFETGNDFFQSNFQLRTSTYHLYTMRCHAYQICVLFYQCTNM